MDQHNKIDYDTYFYDRHNPKMWKVLEDLVKAREDLRKEITDRYNLRAGNIVDLSTLTNEINKDARPGAPAAGAPAAAPGAGPAVAPGAAPPGAGPAAPAAPAPPAAEPPRAPPEEPGAPPDARALLGDPDSVTEDILDPLDSEELLDPEELLDALLGPREPIENFAELMEELGQLQEDIDRMPDAPPEEQLRTFVTARFLVDTARMALSRTSLDMSKIGPKVARATVITDDVAEKLNLYQADIDNILASLSEESLMSVTWSDLEEAISERASSEESLMSISASLLEEAISERASSEESLMSISASLLEEGSVSEEAAAAAKPDWGPFSTREELFDLWGRYIDSFGEDIGGPKYKQSLPSATNAFVLRGRRKKDEAGINTFSNIYIRGSVEGGGSRINLDMTPNGTLVGPQDSIQLRKLTLLILIAPNYKAIREFAGKADFMGVDTGYKNIENEVKRIRKFLFKHDALKPSKENFGAPGYEVKSKRAFLNYRSIDDNHVPEETYTPEQLEARRLDRERRWRERKDGVDEEGRPYESAEGEGLLLGQGLKIFKSIDEVVKKLEVLIGSMRAGNTSKRVKNDIAEILDFLLKEKAINKKEYLKMYKMYVV